MDVSHILCADEHCFLLRQWWNKFCLGFKLAVGFRWLERGLLDATFLQPGAWTGSGSGCDRRWRFGWGTNGRRDNRVIENQPFRNSCKVVITCNYQLTVFCSYYICFVLTSQLAQQRFSHRQTIEIAEPKPAELPSAPWRSQMSSSCRCFAAVLLRSLVPNGAGGGFLLVCQVHTLLQLGWAF